MKHMNLRYAVLSIAIMTVGFATMTFGQTSTNRTPQPSPTPTPVPVVGIDPAKNVVKVTTSTADPLAVKVVPGRTPFQVRMFASPLGNGNDGVNYPLPAGKRLVIENISAVARIPEGFKVEAALYSYLDSNADGVGDVSDITFHRIAFIDQGAFGGTQILAANHPVKIFADEQIGTSHYALSLQARLNALAPTGSFVQIQVTVSGYLEDLPTAQ